MLLSFGLIFTACLTLRRHGHARWLTLPVQAGILAVVALTGIQIGLTQITGEGVNGAVFYHMRTGLEGGDISQYALSIIGGVVSVVVVIAALWWTRTWLKPGAAEPRRGWDAAILMMVIGALSVHPVTSASASYALRFAFVDQQVAGFHDPILDPDRPDQPRNLVILYLESLERTYMDADRFPGLTPNLTALEDRAISFSDIGQTTGAGFTIGGMVASQCGAPLILSGGANSMRVSQFMSGATCLGDILNEAGYTLSYLGGASVEFAGKGAFYESHGYDEVTGLDQLLPQLEDPEYRAEWGLQDDTLFDLARDRFERLSTAGTPFVLTMLTLDTHHPNGHADTNRACDDLQYGDGSNPMLNSVLCDDFLAGRFIEDILTGPNADNTVIAVMSDHLAMVNTATDLLTAGPRRNLLMILDPQGVQQGVRIDRPGTTLDIGPTLLSHLGFDVPVMGLGTDLMGDRPTLPERLGVSVEDQRAVDQYVMGFQSVYARLWAYPDLEDGLYANTEAGQVQFGHNAFQLPALFAFDEDNTVSQATLGDLRAEETLSQTALNLPQGTRYFWFDDCHALGLANPSSELSRQDGLCMLNGERSVGAGLRALPRSRFFSELELTDILADIVAVSQDQETEGLIRIGQARGDLPLERGFPALNSTDRGVLLQSSSFGAGASFIRRQTTDRLDAGEDWVLGRGLNLVGIDADGRAEIIDRIDQCSRDFDPALHAAWSDLIAETSNRFVAHVIAVHDTAFCGSTIDPVSSLIEGLELPGLQSSAMREPYLAVIGQDGSLEEFTNRHFPRIRVLLDPQGGIEDEGFSQAGLTTGSSVNQPVAAIPPATPAAIVTSAGNSERPAQAIPIAAVAAETGRCVAPLATSAPEIAAVLPLARQLAGSAFANLVSFYDGWWGQEASGRWMGQRESRFSIVLPDTDQALSLSLDLAIPGSREMQLFHEGRLLSSVRLSGRGTLNATLTDLPRGQPLDLTLVSEGPTLTCPLVDGSSNDPRQMAAMLMAITLEQAEPAPEHVAATNPEQNGLCEAPPHDRFDAQPVLSPLPTDRIVPLAEATDLGAVSFSNGWWPQEEFGRWMGAAQGTLEIMLPDTQGTLSLAISTAAFGSDTASVSVSYLGEEIARQQSGISSPLELDVSALPRMVPIELSLTLDPGSLDCPASRSISSDTRALGLMVQSLRLRSAQNLPFGRSIAHGGGRLGGAAITNSFDALAANISRFDVFEIDFNWTSDGELVCLHDWQDSFTSRFGAETATPLDHDLFRRLLADSADRPRNCDLDGLAGWMRANPEVRIVTDVKSDPVLAHEVIAARHPDLLDQFVPQAYQPEEIGQYRALGFQQVIWTLYRFGGDPESVLAQTQAHRPSALTMPLSMARSGLLRDVNRTLGVPVYVHTINDAQTAACLIQQGAAGIYSDDLTTTELDQIIGNNSSCPEDL